MISPAVAGRPSGGTQWPLTATSVQQRHQEGLRRSSRAPQGGSQEVFRRSSARPTLDVGELVDDDVRVDDAFLSNRQDDVADEQTRAVGGEACGTSWELEQSAAAQ